MSIRWAVAPFDTLTLAELYQVLALRQEVFVVEQDCPYLDADGGDEGAMHLMAWREHQLVGYLRILPPEDGTPLRIGRVVVAPSARGAGLGADLMGRGAAAAYELVGEQPIRIHAQAHLAHWYARLGYVRVGETFDEDGIPHVTMWKRLDL